MSAKSCCRKLVLLSALGLIGPGSMGAQDSSPPEPSRPIQDSGSKTAGATDSDQAQEKSQADPQPEQPSQGEPQAEGEADTGIQTGASTQADSPDGKPAMAGEQSLSTWLTELAARSQGRLVVQSKRGADENYGELLFVTLAPLNAEPPIPADSSTNPDQPGLDSGELPAVLLCGDSSNHRHLLELLVQPSDDVARELASELVVYFVPLLESGLGGSRPAIAKDFPVGWLPPTLQPDAGQAPFSRPDSALLRDSLQGHPNILLLLGTDAVAESAWPPVDAPLTADACLSDGSLAAYAWYTFGVPSRTLKPAPEQSLGSYLYDELPRIDGSIQAVENLGYGQWRVDLELNNLGRWQSYSDLGQELAGAKGLVLDVRGGKVVAAASAAGGEPLQLVRGRDLSTTWRLRMAPLPGQTQRHLRLIVEADSDSELFLSVDNAWTGHLGLQVKLEELN